jgi:hypothetical protein
MTTFMHFTAARYTRGQGIAEGGNVTAIFRYFGWPALTARLGCLAGSAFPEHDHVEIDRLGLCAPVAINAEPQLCVDEGRTIAWAP